MGTRRPLSGQAPACPSLRSSGSGARALLRLPRPGFEVARLRVRALSGARSGQRRAVRAPVRASLRPAAARGSGALAGLRRLPQGQALPLARPSESASRAGQRAAGAGPGRAKAEPAEGLSRG